MAAARLRAAALRATRSGGGAPEPVVSRFGTAPAEYVPDDTAPAPVPARHAASASSAWTDSSVVDADRDTITGVDADADADADADTDADGGGGGGDDDDGGRRGWGGGSVDDGGSSSGGHESASPVAARPRSLPAPSPAPPPLRTPAPLPRAATDPGGGSGGRARAHSGGMAAIAAALISGDGSSRHGGGGGGSHGESAVSNFALLWKVKSEAARKGAFSLHLNRRESAGAGGGAAGAPAPAARGGGASHDAASLGIPVRELMQQMYTHKRDRIIVDCTFYAVFVAVFFAVVYSLNDSATAYTTNANVVNAIVTQNYDALGAVTFGNQGASGGYPAAAAAAGAAFPAGTTGSAWDVAAGAGPPADPSTVVLANDPLNAVKSVAYGFFPPGAAPGFAAGASFAASDLAGVVTVNCSAPGAAPPPAPPPASTLPADGRVQLAGALPAAPAVGTLALSNTYYTSFLDVGTFENLRDFLVGPFVEGLYQTAWYNGDAMTADESRYVANNMLKLTHGVRLWQVRASNTTCGSGASAANVARFGAARARGAACYGALVAGDNDARAPYGPPWNTTKFRWSSFVGTPITGLPGYGPATYGQGGYVAFLGTSAATARATLADLIASRWIDRATRVVAMDFNLFNADVNVVTTARLLAEVLPTGYVTTSFTLYTYRLDLYSSTTDYVRAVGEAAVAAGVLYYVCVEVGQFWRSRPRMRYFQDPANGFDMLLQALLIASIVYWARFVLTHDSGFSVPCAVDPAAAGASSTCFVDLLATAQTFSFAVTSFGFVGLLLTLKFFKYFSISRRLNSIWLTLYKSATALAAFIFSFGVVVTGFAFLGQQAFGGALADFHNFQSAFSVLLRWPLGAFDYPSLARARPEVAPVYFTLYMALVFLACTNLVIAILTIGYEKVHHEVESQEKWKHAGRTVLQYWSHRARVAGRSLLRWATRGRRGTSLAGEAATLDAENYYYAVMRKFVEDAENHSRVDVLEYVSGIYDECAAGSNIFIGVNELCALSRDAEKPTPPFCSGGHRPRASDPPPAAPEPRGGALLRALGCGGGCCGGAPAAEPPPPPTPTPATKAGAAAGAARGGRGGAAGGGAAGGSVHTRNPLGAASSAASASASSTASALPPLATRAALEAAHSGRCIAWQMVQAYFAHRDVTCVGPTERHQFWGDRPGVSRDDSDSAVLAKWVVKKINRESRAQKRVLSIERASGAAAAVGRAYILTTRDSRMRLKRQVSIASVVQIDAMLADARRVQVYLEASPGPVVAREKGEGAAQPARGPAALASTLESDTLYDLVFPTADECRAFVEKVLRLREEMLVAAAAAAAGGDHGRGGGSGGGGGDSVSGPSLTPHASGHATPLSVHASPAAGLGFGAGGGGLGAGVGLGGGGGGGGRGLLDALLALKAREAAAAAAGLPSSAASVASAGDGEGEDSFGHAPAGFPFGGGGAMGADNNDVHISVGSGADHSLALQARRAADGDSSSSLTPRGATGFQKPSAASSRQLTGGGANKPTHMRDLLVSTAKFTSVMQEKARLARARVLAGSLAAAGEGAGGGGGGGGGGLRRERSVRFDDGSTPGDAGAPAGPGGGPGAGAT